MTATLCKIAAKFDTVLNLKTAIWATSATLDSATDDSGVTLPTGRYWLTIDGGTASEEFITCTLTSTALTSIKTVTMQGVETSGMTKTHRKGATVKITDFVVIKKMLDLLDGTTSFDASTPLGYDWTATISTANQFATKEYADWLAIAGSPDSSTTVKGIGKVSVAPASATEPIFVGDNDGRVPTTGENDALVGNNLDIAVGTGNKFVTQTGLQHNAEKYAADAWANDTYVITLSPVPTSYTNGMVVYFKANTANTGAATLNVNSLGAITIVKGISTTLENWDIAAGQFCTVIYNGTNFVLTSPVSVALPYTNWTTTRAWDTASGTQTIAHWGGKVPKNVRITATFQTAVSSTVSDVSTSIGCYNGTTNSYIYTWNKLGNGSGTNSLVSGVGGASGVFIYQNDTGWTQVAVITVDATNITLTWTKTGTVASDNISILWEAQF